MVNTVKKFFEDSNSYGIRLSDEYPIRYLDGDIYYLTEDEDTSRVELDNFSKTDSIDMRKEWIMRDLRKQIDAGKIGYPKCNLNTIATICASILQAREDIKEHNRDYKASEGMINE